MKCKYKSMYWSCTIATRILGPIRIATGLFLYCSYICFISIQHFLKHFDHFSIKKNTCSLNPSLPWNPVVLDNFRKYFSLQKPPSPWNLQWPWGGGGVGWVCILNATTPSANLWTEGHGMSSIPDWDFTGKKIKMPLQKKAMTRFKLSWYLDKKVLKIPYLHFVLLLTGN